MELSAVSNQRSANTLFLMSFAESRKLMADSAPVLRSSLLGGWKSKNVSFRMSTN